MDPGVKVAAALSVLFTAICMALLFWGDPGKVASPGGRPLKVRSEPDPAATAAQPPPKPDLFFPPLHSDANAGRPPMVLAPRTPRGASAPCDPQGCPVPAPNRPAAETEERAGWGTAAGVNMPELRVPAANEEAAPRTHTIVDGDTLRDLARRYLGAADRYLEIHQWNSDVLANPDVLPIGGLLRIPPRTRPDSGSSEVIERPLVPIRQPSRE